MNGNTSLLVGYTANEFLITSRDSDSTIRIANNDGFIGYLYRPSATYNTSTQEAWQIRIDSNGDGTYTANVYGLDVGYFRLEVFSNITLELIGNITGSFRGNQTSPPNG